MEIKKLLNNFIWLVVDKIFKSLGTFLLNLQVISFLSIENYGVLSYALAINLFITAVISFFRDVLVKEFTIDKNNRIEILGVFCGITVFRVLILLLGWGVLFNLELDSSVFYIVLSSLVNLSDIPECYWQSTGKLYKPVLSRLFIFILFAILKIITLSSSGHSLDSFARLIFFESIGYTFFSYAILLLELNFTKLRITYIFERTYKIIHVSIPLLLNNLFTVGYMRVDQIIIKALLTSTLLGVYSFTLNIAEMLQAAPFMLGVAVAPLVFESTSNENLLEKLGRMMSFMLVIGLIGIFSLLLIYPFIAKHYEISNSYPIMIIVAIGTYPTFVSYLASKYLVHAGFMKHFLKRSFTASVISLSLNYLLVPYFGLFASAFIYSLSQWYIGFFSNYSLSDKALFQTQKRAFIGLITFKSYEIFYNECFTIVKLILKRN